MAQDSNNSTGGGAGGQAATYQLDSSLESKTRSIFFRLNGRDATESEWDIFFGRTGGGMSGKTDRLLRQAHDYAKRAVRSGGGAGGPAPPNDEPPTSGNGGAAR